MSSFARRLLLAFERVVGRKRGCRSRIWNNILSKRFLLIMIYASVLVLEIHGWFNRCLSLQHVAAGVPAGVYYCSLTSILVISTLTHNMDNMVVFGVSVRFWFRGYLSVVCSFVRYDYCRCFSERESVFYFCSVSATSAFVSTLF